MTTSSSTASHPTGVRTYKGRCLCGAVRFEFDVDLSAGTNRCNCTSCTKTGWWSVVVKPEAFRLVAGRETLGDYSLSEDMHARFCGTCGVRTFSHGDVPDLGGAFYSVNLNCLEDADLTGVPVRYLDGRHDTWAELARAPYVSPFVSESLARA
ncbi:MAG: GFA family protein [Cystobacter sp.]